MEDPTRPNTTIYISGLNPQTVNSTTLSEIFIPFGEITSISLPRPEAPSSTDLHRGFGYVEFEDAGDAKEAINNMDQSELFGRVIKVSMAKGERREEKAGVGSTVAVWEQEGYGERFGEGKVDGEGDGQEEGGKVDPMQGLEGLDVAGPRAG
ncbi:hypothetical protein PMZ80_003495 [Knufia obscura]|uniref:RRM domain-containing protein n=2 Tax=Knufia TaxID=430999 RepID=A0AAN8F7V3_9EURO|nr:hypothetical protein PMZ80_003495 [Knufia obscura]KAK5958588.1 hypothetical protein OHC33_000431 [Knufia fluminis]